MPKKAANPFPGDYEPELDTTPTLNPELSLWYASLIGMLRWMVENGRVDIITEVSKMASQMASPREGHLDALMHIFGFLRINHNSRMAYDPSLLDIPVSGILPLSTGSNVTPSHESQPDPFLNLHLHTEPPIRHSMANGDNVAHNLVTT